jgi:hypothetical protein
MGGDGVAAKKEKTAPKRNEKGQFVKGESGNPRGRTPLPPEFRQYAREAPDRLRAICDDPETPVKVRAEIERWFAEMWYGKAPQAVDLDGKVETGGTQVVEFKGVLEEWSQ